MEKLKLKVIAGTSATEVLEQIGINFEIYGGTRPGEVSTDEEITAFCKKVIDEEEKNTVVLISFTEFWKEDEKIGIPLSSTEAAEMLEKLSGESHCFITRLCIGGAGQPPEVETVKTTVTMKALDAREIKGYLSMDDYTYPGAYNPMGIGSFFVRSVQGDYNNIKGMPVAALTELLERKYGASLVNGKNIWRKEENEND